MTPDLIGESPEIVRLRRQIERLVRTSHGARRLPAILLQGETGTGKGLVARYIHRQGPRAGATFVDINCAAIPETLLEAELFGFARGAFTDAWKAKQGLFQAAHGGTLFLDEIGTLAYPLQSKLLKAIEDRVVRRLGATAGESVDVWLISASNEDLRAAVAAGRFRGDLYHRLSAITLHLPPLRERGGDVVLLAEHFLARARADYGLPATSLTEDAPAALEAYSWPGNIRELANLMEQIALSAEGPVAAETLALPVSSGGLEGDRGQVDLPSPPASPNAADPERLTSVLRDVDWNLSRAAARLGIPRNTLRYRLQRTGSDSPPPTGKPTGPRSTGEIASAAPPSLRWEQGRVTILRATVSAASTVAVDAALGAAIEAARTLGGHVEEIGDREVVFAFGLDAADDAPHRAVLAAMAIREAAREGQTVVAGPVTWRLAIHAGEVLIGRIGDTRHIDSATKRALLTALDRLNEETDPDTIVVSAATVPALESSVELAPLAGEDVSTARLYRVVGV